MDIDEMNFFKRRSAVVCISDSDFLVNKENSMYLKRDIYNLMLNWRRKKSNKVLYLRGARQVGKTYLARKLGEEEFDQFIEINMSDITGTVFYETYKEHVQGTTLHDVDSGKCLRDTLLQLFPDFTDDINTLIFIDEIQESQDVFNMIRHFSRKLNCKVIISGSYLGITVREGFFLPAGDLYELTIGTLSFSEFLGCFNESDLFCHTDLFGRSEKSNYNKLSYYYNIYSQIGDYPDVIKEYMNTKSIYEAKNVLTSIINTFIQESVRYLDGVYDGPLFLDVLNCLGSFAINNKTGCSDLIDSLNKFIQKRNTLRIHSRTLTEVIAWLHSCDIISYIPKYVDGRVDNICYRQKIYFTDLGVVRYFLEGGNIIDSSIDGFLAENFVYKSFLERFRNTVSGVQIRKIGFANYTPTKGELDFFVPSPLDRKIYGIEVKNGNNVANTGNTMLKKGLLDYLYVLKGNTLDSSVNNTYTVPIYFAERLSFGGDIK